MQRTSWFFLIAIVCVTGCGESGPPMGSVKGQVTMYGTPYTKGIVTFTPADGGPAGVSRTGENGEYELWSSGRKGAVIGKHKVSVTTIMEAEVTSQPSDMKSDDPKYAEMMTNQDPYKKVAAKKDPIPAKYNSQTELSFDVVSGSNKFDIPLK